MKSFLRPFSPYRLFKQGSCQLLAKGCALSQYWLTAHLDILGEKVCSSTMLFEKGAHMCCGPPVTEFHFRKAYQSHYSSVIQMINNLGWRSCLKLFYKIVYGLVEISLPPYIQRQVRMTRSMHPYHFIQLHTSPNYSKYSFFPLAIVQWNSLPSSAVLSDDLTTFRSVICMRHQSMP